MKKMEQLIKKINEFSALAKKRELTSYEKQVRKEVRNEYRKLFKQGLNQRLQNIKFINKEKEN